MSSPRFMVFPESLSLFLDSHGFFNAFSGDFIPRLQWRFGLDVRAQTFRATWAKRWTWCQRCWETIDLYDVRCFLLLDVFLRIIYDMVLFDMVFHFWWFWLRGAFYILSGFICHLVCWSSRCNVFLSLFRAPISTHSDLSIFRYSSPHFMKFESNNKKKTCWWTWPTPDSTGLLYRFSHVFPFL